MSLELMSNLKWCCQLSPALEHYYITKGFGKKISRVFTFLIGFAKQNPGARRVCDKIQQRAYRSLDEFTMDFLLSVQDSSLISAVSQILVSSDIGHDRKEHEAVQVLAGLSETKQQSSTPGPRPPLQQEAPQPAQPQVQRQATAVVPVLINLARNPPPIDPVEQAWAQFVATIRREITATEQSQARIIAAIQFYFEQRGLKSMGVLVLQPTSHCNLPTVETRFNCANFKCFHCARCPYQEFVFVKDAQQIPASVPLQPTVPILPTPSMPLQPPSPPQPTPPILPTPASQQTSASMSSFSAPPQPTPPILPSQQTPASMPPTSQQPPVSLPLSPAAQPAFRPRRVVPASTPNLEPSKKGTEPKMLEEIKEEKKADAPMEAPKEAAETNKISDGDAEKREEKTTPAASSRNRPFLLWGRTSQLSVPKGDCNFPIVLIRT